MWRPRLCVYDGISDQTRRRIDRKIFVSVYFFYQNLPSKCMVACTSARWQSCLTERRQWTRSFAYLSVCLGAVRCRTSWRISEQCVSEFPRNLRAESLTLNVTVLCFLKFRPIWKPFRTCDVHKHLPSDCHCCWNRLRGKSCFIEVR
jgi:hypothetical protein